ncbi:tRNA(Ile)-lysidine synthase [Brevirhabdus pacifica]|uniref:tRNA lysidine(34) synthetase TilS n=2 Tax=Brevirhabdus pacifica TaxID=1267768 RepID=UPI000CC01B9E|nr:tRNA lysidine(34) synthetase TilS [Brevirhabdus pacifica]PJJ85978.1 tRNA(Ile)-lysidine synthase [Brevirhabdus pacifica]
MTAQDRFDNAMAAILGAADDPDPSRPPTDGGTPALGLAVSGGSDSLALMHLAAAWAAPRAIRLRVATVDHRLRPESGTEAREVAHAAAALDLPHEILEWTDGPGAGNLQANARDARRRLLGDWAARHGLTGVLTGHTADDQAETVLLRLARGSGVDGLAAMRPGRPGRSLFLRPLLGHRREELRDLLRAKGLTWAEDPGNEDSVYDRVKARRALALLAPLGIDVEGVNRTADAMARAREALERRGAEAAAAMTREEGADLLIEVAPWRLLDDETRLRLLAAGLMWVGGQDYRPRLRALEDTVRAAAAGRRATLHGVVIHPAAGWLRLYREPSALIGVRARPGDTWDNRWILAREAGTDTEGAQVEMLGEEGLTALDPRPAPGVPRDSLLGLPAVWRAGRVICVPHLGMGGGFRATRAGEQEFTRTLLSH